MRIRRATMVHARIVKFASMTNIARTTFAGTIYTRSIIVARRLAAPEPLAIFPNVSFWALVLTTLTIEALI